jgi:hypothetical protein
MRSSSRRWRAEAFGSVCCLSTRAMGGRIRLCTFVCTPNPGTDLPVLLIDASALREEAEYYGCTARGAVCGPMQAVFGTYRDLVVHRLPRALFAHQVIGPERTRGLFTRAVFGTAEQRSQDFCEPVDEPVHTLASVP